MPFKTANSVWAYAAGTIAPGDTTWVLASGHGARFSFLSAADYTYVTLINEDVNPPTEEVGKLTYSGSGDSVNVVRAQDGTSALTVSTPGKGRIEVRIPRAVLNALVLNEDLQTLTDVTATSIAGTVDAITSVHAKPLSDIATGGVVPDGTLSIVEPGGSNTITNPSYAPDGLPAKIICRPGGDVLQLGDLRLNYKAWLQFDASLDRWVLVNPLSRQFISGAVKSAGFNITRANMGQLIRCDGTFTVTFDAASALGSDFWCVIKNVGVGTITLDPNGSEVIYIPGGSQAGDATMTIPYSGTGNGPYNVSGVHLASDGAALQVISTLETHGSQMFTTVGSGSSWVCPAGVRTAWLTLQGGGGGGAVGTYNGSGYAGGSGGATSVGALASVGGGSGGNGNYPPVGGAGGTGDIPGAAGVAVSVPSGTGPAVSGGSSFWGDVAGPGLDGARFGAGGGCASQDDSNVGGGGGGATFKKPVTTVPGTSYTVTVGGGGAGSIGGGSSPKVGAQGFALIEW